MGHGGPGGRGSRASRTRVGEKLRAAGVAPASLIISASHTHSGPGAFGDSGLWAFLAVDRVNTAVRSALIDAVVRAIVRAEAAKVPARVAAFTREGPDVTTGRLRLPVDREIVGLRLDAVERSGAGLPVELRHSRHHARGREPALLRGRDGRGVGSPGARAEGARAVRERRRRRRESAPPRAGRRRARWRPSWPRPSARAGGRAARCARYPSPCATTRVSLPAPVVSVRNCLGAWVPRGADPAARLGHAERRRADGGRPGRRGLGGLSRRAPVRAGRRRSSARPARAPAWASWRACPTTTSDTSSPPRPTAPRATSAAAASTGRTRGRALDPGGPRSDRGNSGRGGVARGASATRRGCGRARTSGGRPCCGA